MKFGEFVCTDAISTELLATDKQGAIHEMVQTLLNAEQIAEEHYEPVVRSILNREELGSTGMGRGAAIQRSGDADLPAFTAYCDHEAIKPHLSEFEICPSLVGTEYWLILDRRDDQAYVALANKAKLFLKNEHSPQESMKREINEARREFERSVLHTVTRAITIASPALSNEKGVFRTLVRWVEC